MAFNSIFQVLFYSLIAWLFIKVLPPLLGIQLGAIDLSKVTMGNIAQKRLHLPGHSVPRRNAHPARSGKAKGKIWYEQVVHPQNQPNHADCAAVYDRRDVQPARATRS